MRLCAAFVLLMFLTADCAGAIRGSYFPPDGLIYAVGTIHSKRRNTFEIYDEKARELKTFVYLGSDDFKEGDRVRIYFNARSRVIEDIRKMTPLPYKPNEQNLGNIYRSQ